MTQMLNIIQFIKSPHLLNIQFLSRAQQALLKTLYKFPLDEVELEIHRRACGRDSYTPREYSEMDVIAGRRSGKTLLGALIACYEAFVDHGVPRGERAYILLIAPVMAQARIGFRFSRKLLLGSRTLSKHVVKVRRDEIELRNGVVIACVPCSYVTVRGMTVVAAICDEMAFWRHEETAANPEEEVLEALRPAMATVKNAKLLKNSTPFRKEGILFREFQQRAELDFPVWQASTFQMNPAIQASVLERERQRNEERFRREYLAEFTENIVSWIDAELLEACVVRGRRELPQVPKAVYVAALDPAFVHSNFALTIAHLLPDGTVVVDRVARWRGTQKMPLESEWVCGEIKHILDQFDIDRAVGDQHCFHVIRQQLLKLGINYEQLALSEHRRPEVFGNLKYLLMQRKIELLDDPELLSELRSLEEQKTERGQVDVRPSGRMRDDLAVTLALAANELTKGECVLPAPEMSIVTPDFRPSLHLNPFDCPLAAICANFPQCQDEGGCLDFKDERVSPGPVYIPR